ncbi:hypothetical protein PsorP6_003905 [Peronosclerospora sorghi]|uniref:Uncharacterized protein n=1 Tax=Peronosclerospora sorghi TaxID=230839 RepID=A0ACC0VRU9_9STRA|nr:hypothetical protein PsorP6_003905 [Peronosclerospora sorghi]
MYPLTLVVEWNKNVSTLPMIRFERSRFIAAMVLLMTSGTAFADLCSLVTSTYSNCQLFAMCSHCIATSGCKYNLENGTCISLSSSSPLSALTFCNLNDSVCASCTTSSSKQPCTGADKSCICLSLCDIVSPNNCTTDVTDSSTNNTHGFSMIHAVVAFGALSIVFVLFVQRKCTEQRENPNNRYVQQIVETTQEQRRREVERQRQRRPELALNLKTWRDHVELHKPQMSKVELESRFYLMIEDEKKHSRLWDSGSEEEMKDEISAVHFHSSSDMWDPISFQGPAMGAPYVAMREEYPSNATTDGSNS